MMHYLWWIPSVILMYIVYAWVAHQNNTQDSMRWFVLLSCIGAFPLWSIVSRTSKNLVIDGFIYNFFLLTAESFALIYFTGMKPSPVQWSGVAMSLVGFLLIST